MFFFPFWNFITYLHFVRIEKSIEVIIELNHFDVLRIPKLTKWWWWLLNPISHHSVFEIARKMLIHVDYFFEISFGIFGILINAIFERIIGEIYISHFYYECIYFWNLTFVEGGGSFIFSFTFPLWRSLWRGSN